MNSATKGNAANLDHHQYCANLTHTERRSVSSRNDPLANEPVVVQLDTVVAIEEKVGPAAYEAPPDGGFQAWLQVAGSFFLFFNSWGTVNTFGVFQTYYETGLLSNESPSNISWIGSTQSFLLLLIGVISGPLYDAGYFRALVLTGSFLIVFGFMMTSLCTQYWQVLLAQAICIGTGNGCLYIPSVAILPQYFSTRKALATGIAASGSSLGGVLCPIVFRQLQPRIGFAWATRVLGFIYLFTSIISLSLMRVRNMPKERRSLLELPAFKEPPYTIFCVAMFFGYVGLFGPIFYVQPYAIQTKVMSEDLAFFLVPILNAASIPGRILPGFLAGRVGPVNMLVPAAICTGVLALCWTGIHNTPGVIMFAALYGFFSGGFVSLPAVALTSLTPDLRTLGTRMGMCSVICSLGSLGGAPVSGAILTATGGYLGVQLFSGLTIFLTGMLLVVTRVAKAGPKIRLKV